MAMRKPLLAGAAICTLLASGVAAAQAVTYQVDPTHTFVVFEADHHGTSTVRGRFDRSEGSVTLDRAARTGRAEITIDLASIDTGVKPFDGKLKGPEFLNAAELAQAKFVGDTFSFDGNKVSAVAGTLTLLGRSQPLTLKATGFNCYTSPLLKREVCGGDFETTLVRSLWGMTQGLDTGLPDRIRLLVQIEAIRQ
jgi:polyisoprenoid-binding protein YceI